MRVAVTGGAGFIGANLVRRLLKEDAVRSVVAVDDLSSGFRANLEGLSVELHTGTILDGGLLDRAFADCDAVVHLAAVPSVPRSIVDPMASHQANATGTLTVLEAVRRQGNPYVVLASSSSVYGANPELPKHERLRTEPMSPYAVSKQATEAYGRAYANCYGLDLLPLRFFNVFGPLQPAGHAYAAVVPAFLDAALAGRPLTIYGDGRQSRDFTYVGTVCEVLLDAVRRRVSSAEPVNLAFGTSTTLLEVVELLESSLGRRLEVHHAPPRAGDVVASQADAGRLRQLFPSAEPTPLETGLEETLKWFRSAG